MFRGNHSLTLDSKGRLAVPKKYRDCLVADFGLKMVITKDRYESCLVVYPLPEWQRIEEKLSRHPDLEPDAADETQAKAEWTRRLIIGNANDCDIDSHGRMLIPPPLRAHAHLGKQVRMVGLLEKFELWDEATWSHRSADEHDRLGEPTNRAQSLPGTASSA